MLKSPTHSSPTSKTPLLGSRVEKKSATVPTSFYGATNNIANSSTYIKIETFEEEIQPPRDLSEKPLDFAPLSAPTESPSSVDKRRFRFPPNLTGDTTIELKNYSSFVSTVNDQTEKPTVCQTYKGPILGTVVAFVLIGIFVVLKLFVNND